jgi:hypothetical protein
MAVVSWTNTTLASVGDVNAFLTDLSIPLATNKRDELEQFVINKIATVKNDFIRPRLQELFTKVYPDTVDRWIQYAELQLDSERERMAKLYDQSGANYVVLPGSYAVGAYLTGSYLPFFMDSFGSGLPPRTYYNYGTPTNGTAGSFAGTAENGSFLVDTRYRQLYINRGTLSSPTWSAFIAENLIDYLANADVTNGQVLKRSTCAGAIWLCLLDGEMKNNSNWDQNFELLAEVIKRWKAYYDEWFAQDVTLLKVDISGDGIITEYERMKLRKNTIWVA